MRVKEFKMLTVYLAGGMHTEWRKRVKEEVAFALYLDPTSHGLRDEAAYTQWDIVAIEQSDVVFAYLEKENPSGLGLMFELGYAAAKPGKITIFVNEWEEKPEDIYVGMARAAASLYFTSLDKAISYLLGMCVESLVDLRLRQETSEQFLREELKALMDEFNG
jgi:nucleoside 2-deoxyribosyltransferase